MTQQLHFGGHLSKRNENVCSQDNLYTNGISALFIIVKTGNNPNVLQQVKVTVGYTYHGMLLSNKKKQTIDTQNSFDGSQVNYAE